MMKSLVDIATSGASPELVVELMAKQLEKRLQALEAGNKAQFEAALESKFNEVIAILSKQKPSITVNAAEQPAPVVNISPSVTVVEKEEKKMKITVERNLSGSIESLTVVKG